MKSERSRERNPAQVVLRPPDMVMRLARMGAFFPTRISFMRTLLRRLSADQAVVERRIWDICPQGYGCAVYCIRLGGQTYSLVAFSAPLEPEQRTDRVIAEAWDTSYVLYDGVPSVDELARLRKTAPLQEAGRFEARDLVLSRANRSVRLFEHIVDCLAHGTQPAAETINSIGYLMRTTAVYGNGKFGIADRMRIAQRPGLSGPFQAEMLTVWLVRGFTHDLVEHIARHRAPSLFVPLERRLKRHLGIGNATGLGMAPFLVSHPVLLSNWMTARETAIARVRAIASAVPEDIARVRYLIARVLRHLKQWSVVDERQMARINRLGTEVCDLQALMTAEWFADAYPWDRLVREADRYSMDCQELVAALIMEPHGDLVDGLAECMTADETVTLRADMRVGDLRQLIETAFDWALAIDFADRSQTARFWYVSQDKLEPRLGERHHEDGASLELPLDIARRVKALHADLAGATATQNLAEFLMRLPKHRYAALRVQAAASHPYAEIRDNLIGADCMPIDMLRCKLSFFGATKFDPKSDRWTRITMYQGAPLFDEIASENADDWWLPVLDGL